MEIRAYNELFVDDAMNGLGEVFDLALRQEHIEPSEFSDMFTKSMVCKLLERGNLRYLDGVSPMESLGMITGREINQRSYIEYGPEFWSGYILAYVNWYTNLPFERILRNVPLASVLSMYGKLHEVDITKTLGVIIEEMDLENPLLAIRKYVGFTQDDLARISGVNIRSIRAYEQGQVDIRAARADIVYSLARVLGCTVEDLVRAPAI